MCDQAQTVQGTACLVYFLAFVRWNVCYDKTAGLHVNIAQPVCVSEKIELQGFFFSCSGGFLSPAVFSGNSGTDDISCAARRISGDTRATSDVLFFFL